MPTTAQQSQVQPAVQDPTIRQAARLAALLALPVALLVGLGVAWRIGAFGDSSPGEGPDRAGPAGGTSTSTPTGSPDQPGLPPPAPNLPALDPAAAGGCQGLTDRLPASLRELPGRSLAAGRAVAYGDPPIVLTCGAPAPVLPPEADVYLLSGVCWYAERQRWSTLDRAVTVEVTVPGRYTPPGQWVIDFSGPVAASFPAEPGAPAGCRPDA